MSKSPDPAQLQNRFHILDILFVTMLPAFIASGWPQQRPDNRLMIFLLSLIPAIGSGWWSSSLIQTFKIKSTLKRLGIHLGAFIGFVSFPIFLMAFIGMIDQLMDRFRPRALESLGIMVLMAIPSFTMIYFETRRQKKVKLSTEVVRTAMPLENKAAIAAGNARQQPAAPVTNQRRVS